MSDSVKYHEETVFRTKPDCVVDAIVDTADTSDWRVADFDRLREGEGGREGGGRERGGRGMGKERGGRGMGRERRRGREREEGGKEGGKEGRREGRREGGKEEGRGRGRQRGRERKKERGYMYYYFAVNTCTKYTLLDR